MTNILSFDVGIKNLAYCYMSKKDNDEFVINDWNIINLNDDGLKCNHEIKDDKECGKPAKYTVNNKNNDTKYNLCDTHKKAHTKSFELIKKTKKMYKCSVLKCENTAKYTIKDANIHCCDDHYETSKKKYDKNISSKKIQGTECGKQPLSDLATKLFIALDKLNLDIEQEIDILIENQPTLKNPTMKSISMLLFSFFIARKIDKKINVGVVKFICPSNKLFKLDKENASKIILLNKDKKYKTTKELGMNYCTAVISDKDNKKIEGFKKKDDLCDAFLQGFQFMYDGNIPDKFLEKIYESNKQYLKKINK